MHHDILIVGGGGGGGCSSYTCGCGTLCHRMAMLRALGLKRPYEPKPRFVHYAGAARGELFVFAGRTVDFDKTKEELSSTIQVFDQYLEQWRQPLQNTGCPPKGLYGGGCCVSLSGDLYVYGGQDSSNLYCGGLYKLSSEKWSQLSGETDVKFNHLSPMKKYHCRMVRVFQQEESSCHWRLWSTTCLTPAWSIIHQG